MQKKLMKILTYVTFGISAVFMIIAVSLCVKHLIWNNKGEKVTATYIDHHIGYIADKEYRYEELANKYIKYVDENNKIVIIYDHKDHGSFYCIKAISNVFIFAGIGFAFLIGTFVFFFLQNKKPKAEVEDKEEEPVKKDKPKEDDEEFVVRRIDTTKSNDE